MLCDNQTRVDGMLCRNSYIRFVPSKQGVYSGTRNSIQYTNMLECEYVHTAYIQHTACTTACHRLWNWELDSMNTL